MKVTFSKEDLQVMDKIEKSMEKGTKLNEYQEKAMSTCMPTSENFSYMMLNLVGEVGEFASKVGKAVRKGKVSIGRFQVKGNDVLSDSDLYYKMTFEEEGKFDDELKKEAGDILWQLSGLCSVMGWSLEDVAQMNLDKLQARKKAGTIDGSGDGVDASDGRK